MQPSLWQWRQYSAAAATESNDMARIYMVDQA